MMQRSVRPTWRAETGAAPARLAPRRIRRFSREFVIAVERPRTRTLLEVGHLVSAVFSGPRGKCCPCLAALGSLLRQCPPENSLLPASGGRRAMAACRLSLL